MEKAIDVRGLTKVFGRFEKLVAVNDLNLSIERGAVYGFIGPNGAGKTTTIKMLVGAMKPTEGHAWILGQPAGSVKAKSRIGYSPEHPSFYDMSAQDFLVYTAKVSGLSGQDASSRASELLNWMGLSEAADRNARNFSSGMKQKLSIVQALIHDPDVLILDEPTANLDPLGRFDVLEKIRELADKMNKTVFVSSHILQELEKVVDHVAIINEGNTVLQSSIDELRQKFSEKHFIVDTVDNEKFLGDIEAFTDVQEAWISHKKRIEALVDNPEGFKRDLFKLFRGKEDQINEFSPFTMSLENLFMKVIEGEKNDK